MSVNTYLTTEELTRLERAVVGIAGAGGLGSNVASHLVRAGVRRFVIADFDVVSPSNLNRQFFFCDQIGRRKVEALAENLRRIEPDLELTLHDVRLDAANMPSLFGACDVVVEAFDNVESKSALLSALREKPVVSASGLAGWGRSNEMKVRRIGGNLVLVGDCSSDIRAGLAAAMQANAALALLLGHQDL